MASLRVKTQEATQRLTQKVIRKVIMEAQNLEERIERMQWNVPITLTKEQEEKLQGIVSSIKDAVDELKEAREQQHILGLLKGKLPVNQGIAVLSSYLSTLQKYISDSLVNSNETIDEWVEVEDMDGTWDTIPEAERMLAKQKRIEAQKTKNQMMRELLEKERKGRLDGTFTSYSDAQQSVFLGHSKAIDDLRPLFQNTAALEDDDIISL